MPSESANPYQSPGDRHQFDKKPPSLIGWCVGIVVATSITCGMLGMVIGGLLGQYLPSYYRSVFNAADDPGFDPFAVGIGLGLTQGIMFGAFVGLASFGLYYWILIKQTHRR